MDSRIDFEERLKKNHEKALSKYAYITAFENGNKYKPENPNEWQFTIKFNDGTRCGVGVSKKTKKSEIGKYLVDLGNQLVNGETK